MDLVGCVERVLDLRTLDLATQPLPGPDTAASRVVGHGYLVLYLSASEEFDDNGHVVEVLERFEQDCAGLEAAVSELWGPAVGVDLRPFMDSMVRGESVPELSGFLAGIVSEVSAWHLLDRSICVGVGLCDTHGPVVLIAAVGDLRRHL
ncbi:MULTISPECIES: hypothetical protein [unclassified Micromonospora]|uniref:hypothetical protein n=1 Tax=unclassified Micromonospora TaxID=2617518 RepID=UPI001C24B569|nr:MULTISPECIES: hypothetical protein [unclassified Micromonospora]MBU8856661.1 hypothetical protein [Micromonospora sp. WMMB482]MDM4782275.1 hypothetical protein [Micromonospora sp. b486]